MGAHRSSVFVGVLCVAVALARADLARSQGLSDITGTWVDSKGDVVTIAEEGALVRITESNGLVLSGHLSGNEILVSRRFTGHEVNMAPPEIIRQINGRNAQVLFEGNVVPSGNAIEGRWTKPAHIKWEGTRLTQFAFEIRPRLADPPERLTRRSLEVDWKMPRRVPNVDTFWGRQVDGLPGEFQVNPEEGWAVELFLTVNGREYCPSGYSYRWHVDGKQLDASSCKVVAYEPLGSHEVIVSQLQNDVATGNVGRNKDVRVNDLVILGMGDSNGSGEGIPPYFFPQCDRSASSAQYKVAKRVEDTDPHTSVTFIFTSCSGARTEHLWQMPYEGIHPELGKPLLAQADQVRSRLRGRPVDILIMSAGINNISFGPLMAYCATPTNLGACEKDTVDINEDAQGFISSYSTYHGIEIVHATPRRLSNLSIDKWPNLRELAIPISQEG